MTPGLPNNFLSGRRDSTSPMLKQFGWSATSADGCGWQSADPRLTSYLLSIERRHHHRDEELNCFAV